VINDVDSMVLLMRVFVMSLHSFSLLVILGFVIASFILLHEKSN